MYFDPGMVMVVMAIALHDSLYGFSLRFTAGVACRYVSAPLVSKVDQLMTYYWEFVVNLMPLWLA